MCAHMGTSACSSISLLSKEVGQGFAKAMQRTGSYEGVWERAGAGNSRQSKGKQWIHCEIQGRGGKWKGCGVVAALSGFSSLNLIKRDT